MKGLTSEQYEATPKKYPILGDLYSLLREYHRIIFSQKGDELEDWIMQASSLKIDGLDTYKWPTNRYCCGPKCPLL